MVSPLGRRIARVVGFTRSGERVHFDDASYRAANPDVAEAGVDPFQHYMGHGWREGRDPSPRFSTLYYRDWHLGGAAINPLTHYAEAGGARSGLATAPPSSAAFLDLQRAMVSEFFDQAFYTVQSGWHEDPLLHYLAEGWRQGYAPHPGFDPARYVAEHPFVRALGVSPFYHHASQQRLLQGRTKPPSRQSNKDANPAMRSVIAREFDAAYYLAQYSDVRAGKRDPLDHFLDHGWREKRNPTPLFNSAYYRAKNADVPADTNPFYHFLTVGRAEGRRPNPVGAHLYPKLVAPRAADWAACRPAADTATADYVVIMPVYKGYDETLAAIFAVLRARQTVRFALHVINDRTPDERLGAELARLAADGLFSLVTNPTNLGFVKSCNVGMRAAADKHVVLLNADAVVFADWLDRIAAHAERDPRIATITPLSNNATICSYPVVNTNNLIEGECTAEQIDGLAREANVGRVSEVPTGVGFCFYMSPGSRAAVGLFDELAFGRGYGEENDFCLRAAKAGFRNVLAEDVFVYHAGQVSFAELAMSEYAPGQAALAAKHPDYAGRVRQHLTADPGWLGRLRLDLIRLARFAGPRSMVFVSHALSGGIVTHIEHMEERLRAEGIAVVHFRVGVSNRWSVEIGSNAPDAPFCPNLKPTSFNQLRPLLAEFLAWLSPRAIHVHSLAGFDWEATTGMLAFIQGAGIPYYFTLHDYSVVCHRNDLVLTTGRYCGLPDVDACRACVAGDRSYPEAVDPAVRRHTFQAFLASAAAVFAPSNDVKRRLERAGASYPISIRPHDQVQAAEPAQRATPRPSEVVHVVIVGGIGVHKGAQVILDLARDAKARQLPIRYHIVGSSDRTDDMAGAGVEEIGRYAREDEAVASIEALQPACLFLPSIWPETFCYTLSFAFRLGIPPVVFDLGAQRERVDAAGFGFVLPLALINDVSALNDRLIALPYADGPPRHPATGPEPFKTLLDDYYRLPRPDGGS